MTTGSNLPFRRLCEEFGARIVVSEMALAKKIMRRHKSEMALLRRHPSEPAFGVQIAGRSPEWMAVAAQAAAEKGATFVDVNLGCPIDLVTRIGAGAALLESPRRVAAIVTAMKRAVTIPVTIKIRTGWTAGKPTAHAVAKAAEDAGAAAVAFHARSREQRYRQAADWNFIGELAAAMSIPVIGNGDLLTPREVEVRWKQAGCASVMIGRGALIKPWIFREVAERSDWRPTADERLAVWSRYVTLAREHFGDDDHGTARIRRFLKYHLGWACRYRHAPETGYDPERGDHPLMQTRAPEAPSGDGVDATLGRSDEPAIEFLCDVLLGLRSIEEPPPPLASNGGSDDPEPSG
ncbi:MAG: tRNA-dihydrouridine synthase family protein [Planctomycetes bacterium]|nr:tRNA-dihydrouridine synthase family protein [Planctomycetota bacterium]MBI3846199.1 tRNA-dihydrouridine synthase family protein [Planctomycetota bacterium]